MSESITLYDLAPSPNNVKVRIALNYKGLNYEKVPVDGADRSTVIKISGQPLTPVLTHGDRVIFDSAAILRYLDGNFRDTPPLYSSNPDVMREIEKWETIGRTEVLRPIGMVFGQFFQPARDPQKLEPANTLLRDATAKYEERLSKASWLVGEAMSAADVTAAPPIFLAMLTPELGSRNRVHAFFAEHLKLGEGRDAVRAWASRVMAYDR